MAPMKIPIHLPPRQIRLDSHASSASSVTNTSGDDVFYQKLGVSKSSNSKIPPSVKVRPSQEHNIQKDFRRSQGLQGALDRIQKRRSSDPLYQGEKGADPEEVSQMIDLFSKYEGILEHLVHKNQKLKHFVKGETEVYPSQFSYTTVEILETLEKLKLKRAQSFGNAEVPDASPAGAFDKHDVRSRSAGPRMRTTIETTSQNSTQNTRPSSVLRSRFRYSSKSNEADTPKRSGASLQPGPRRSITPKRLEPRQNEEGDMELEVPRSSSKLNASGSGSERSSFSSNRSRENQPTNKPHSEAETSRRVPTHDRPSPKEQEFECEKDAKHDRRYGKSLESSSRPSSVRLHRDRDLREKETIIHSSSKETSAEIISIMYGAKTKQSQTITDSPVSPESRNEKLSPPSIRRETKRPTPLGEMRASPPRLDLIERKRQEVATPFSERDSETEEPGTVNGKESGSSYFSCHGLQLSCAQSTATPPRTPPKHFLPLSPTKKEHNTVPTISRYPDSTNGSGSLSKHSSKAPSERARKLQSEISDVYQYSQELAVSQQRLRGDLQKIKHTYRQRHGYMEDRVFQAMPSPRDGLHLERGHDPMQLSVPQLSCESYTYIESDDGVIHVEKEEIIHLEEGEPVLESRPSYRIEDGVIVVEDDEIEIENHSIPNTITHVEDDPELFPDIPAGAVPDSAHNEPRIDYSYSADEDETDCRSKDSMGRGMPTGMDCENSLRETRKSKRETIVSREQLDREVLRRSTRSLLHSSGSISTKDSGGLSKNKAEIEFVIPAAEGALVPRNKKVNCAKAVKWSDHCGALPCGLASF